jgi:hypothetical protein
MSSNRKFVFVLRGPADIDHMAPVMWQCLENRRDILALVASQYDVERDFRLNFLKTYDGFQMKSMSQLNGRSDKVHKLLRPWWNFYRTRRFLRRNKVMLCAFEWGDGIWSAQGKPDLFTNVKHKLFANLVLQMQYACQSLDIPTVSLPHGHSTKMSLIRSVHIQKVLDANGQKLPFSNRNSFAKYVFASAYHRDVILHNSDLSPVNVEAWGSARFSSEWTKVLYQISPPVNIPNRNPGQDHRVLFFIPKWHNLVDRGATIKLLCALASLPSIQLIIRGHIRGRDTQLTLSELSAITATNAVVVADLESPSTSLISASDVLIDIDSSIAFDAINLGKLYIRPRYLQQESIKTVFDVYGGALQADSQQEILEILSSKMLPSVPVDHRFREVVIGDVQSFIPLEYFRKLDSLANSYAGIN